MQLPIFSTLSLLMAMALFMLGNGPLPTMLGIRLAETGAPVWMIGIVMAQYYLGFVVGSLYGYRLIHKVGHIRAFVAFGSTMSAVTLAHAFIVDPLIWAAFRFIVGICAIGMFMCIESWLNFRANNSNRGQTFALYVIVVYLFSGLGQFLIQLPDSSGFTIYAVISILMSAAIVPVALTQSPAPVLPLPNRFNFLRLWQTSPTGMTIALFAGVVGGAFYGVAPVFAQLSGFDRMFTALFIGSATIGGIILQWPLGKFSDGRDRRSFMLYTSIVMGIVCLLLASIATQSYLLIVLVIIFGGLFSTMYPLAVAYTNDFLDPEDLISATGGLVMAYGIGAIVGPLLASLTIELMNTAGLFVLCAVVGFLAAAFILWRMSRRDSPAIEKQGSFVAVPRTSSVITELDPRGENI